MDKSPLVEVLGSFTSNVVTRKIPCKYQIISNGNGICVDTGMRFSVNSCIFVGTSIGMPMYSGNKVFVKFGHLKFSCMESSQEMLDQ